jgi:hypothetical protein
MGDKGIHKNVGGQNLGTWSLERSRGNICHNNFFQNVEPKKERKKRYYLLQCCYL